MTIKSSKWSEWNDYQVVQGFDCRGFTQRIGHEQMELASVAMARYKILQSAILSEALYRALVME